MREIDEQFKKINDLYTDFVYMHYERRRKGGTYTKRDTDKQADRIITALEVYKEL